MELVNSTSDVGVKIGAGLCCAVGAPDFRRTRPEALTTKLW